MFGLGAEELMLILLIALVLFGGARIPELGRSLGQAIREFKRGLETPDASAEPKPAARTVRSRRDASRLGRRECLTPGRPRL
jgi:sec-independent protein translocase protein TatA